MRTTGKATTAEDLQSWPVNKLADEITKQIRIDCGGKSAIAYLKQQIAQNSAFAYTSEELNELAEFCQKFTTRQLRGSRKRIQSKLNELQRRANHLKD